MTLETLEVAFAEWVKSKRAHLGLDIRDFSAKTGVDIGTISRTANRQTQTMLDTAIRISNGLGVPPEQLLQELLGTETPFLKEIQQESTAGAPILTIEDVEQFLRFFQRDPEAGKLTLVELFNTSFRLWERRPKKEGAAADNLFVVQDIDKLLIDFPLYNFEVQYPQEIEASFILDLCRLGGAITPTDAGIYVKSVRQTKDLTLNNMAQSLGRSMSVLSRLETGSIERLKLLDVLLLDDFLKEEGRIFGVYWKAGEFNAKINQSSIWSANEVKIGNILVAVSRWLLLLDREDRSWFDFFASSIGESLK